MNGNTSRILKYINDSGNAANIYDDLLGKYYKYITCIDARISYLAGKISALSQQIASYDKRINEIKSICNMKSFLQNYKNGTYKDSLWHELCSFRREDVYRNENYAGEGYDNATVTQNVEGLIQRAKEELAEACEVHYSIHTTIGNLLTMKEFEPLWDDFTIGNWLRIINNLLCFTSDSWKHTRLALGKIFYYNDETGQWEWAYGINAEVLIASLILSEMLKIYNKSGTYSITDKGFFFDYKNNTIEINAMEPSFTISKMENGSRHIYMRYSPADGLVIDGTGRFSGFVLVGNEAGKHIKLDPKNPSMVINDGTENIFDFNSDGSGFLTIAKGIITSVLKSQDYIPRYQGMCINLEKDSEEYGKGKGKFIEIYNNNHEELLSFNLDNNNLHLQLYGWYWGLNAELCGKAA